MKSFPPVDSSDVLLLCYCCTTTKMVKSTTNIYSPKQYFKVQLNVRIVVEMSFLKL